MTDWTPMIVAAVVGGAIGLTIRFARRSSDPVARGYAMTIGGCAAIVVVLVGVVVLVMASAAR